MYRCKYPERPTLKSVHEHKQMPTYTSQYDESRTKTHKYNFNKCFCVAVPISL